LSTKFADHLPRFSVIANSVILYDVDPDQLACITCGQQWQATSLRGNW